MRLLQLIAIAALAPRAAAAQSVEAFEARFAAFAQDGSGYQSPDGPAGGPGSEDALIFEPLLRFAIEQSERLSFDVQFSVDVVSAASVDAIDAMSSASAINESGTLDVVSTYRAESGTRWSGRFGFHAEEPFRSAFAGGGVARPMAQDNTTLAASFLVTIDVFDFLARSGADLGETTKRTFNGNLSATQILSPTTWVDVAYGVTYQTGTLETTYNQVPVEDDLRGAELFPTERLRHAAAVRVAQHIPPTRSTLRGSYRFYLDDFGLHAHTAEVAAYQYLTSWLYLRGTYRFHTQDGVDFYGESFPRVANTEPRTADSDLAPLDSHEVGAKVVLLSERSPLSWLRRGFVDASFYRYARSNDLAVLVFGLAYGRTF